MALRSGPCGLAVALGSALALAAAERPSRRPVEDIADAIVYTVNESIHSDAALALASQVPSDVLVRAWFKWRNAPDCAGSAHLVAKAHALGALFGGGITCSALYHGENGLSDARVLDMATRGPDGQLVDAWGTRGCRHGTLSNPAYLDYLLSWCRAQIDAGADYLFMDEINAALQANEGFDDYSIRDFRAFLLRRFPDGKGWPHEGTLGSFDYRAWLKAQGFTARPHARENPLAPEWHAFRRERDDRAWKHLCDAIRAYAASKGRRVLLSANGLAPHVDLQVLGVWGLWRVKDGSIDLSESQLDDWAATVARGHALARRRVPVVFFHDWGFGGFPWLKVAPADRKLWTRVRGAEIYAAGAFFAFPVHGPFGQDASRDSTLAEVARQAAFYQQHKGLYLDARLLGFEPLETKEPLLSLALWRRDAPPALVLHVINRQAEAGQPTARRNVAVRIPGAPQPKGVRIVSPDWSGEKEGSATADAQGTTIVLPEVEAYAVAVLDYDALPIVKLFGSRTVPLPLWARPERNEFTVGKDGTVRDAWALNGFLQGNLHPDLRNPPTFVVHTPKGGALSVHIRAVATLGARLECLIDGRLAKAVDLPDRDKKNDGAAREYDATFEFPIPPGRHRVTVQNTGGDWATVAWYAFAGDLAD
ncbi:MAG TPA: hypothetical protein VNE39_03935 [Planctomycetota bacterium]|nr:hypothetical protein [Planctomycetota bacterium]